jgi:hypothetical protein
LTSHPTSTYFHDPCCPESTPLTGGRAIVGERSEEVARLRGIVVEHILSGVLTSPLDFDQVHYEWVLLLEGRALLAVGDERLDLSAGD